MIENFGDLKNFFDKSEQTVDKPDLRSMNPWRVIKEAAAGLGIRVNDPQPNCKHCHGRGYIGIRHDSGDPIPCRCIWPKSLNLEEENNGYQLSRPMNRAERRKKKRG